MKSIGRFLFRFMSYVLALFVAAYALLIRRWHISWGTRPNESKRMYPGDDMIPLPRCRSTRAVTINASPKEIFPWLLQIGQGRGGFYSYGVLENLIGAGVPQVDSIVPDYQNLKVGDLIYLLPRGLMSFRVDAILPDEAVILRMNNLLNNSHPLGSWVLVLEEEEKGITRLIGRTRIDYEPTWGNFFLWRVLNEPIHFIMERRMLNGIKERVERPQMPMPRAEATAM